MTTRTNTWSGPAPFLAVLVASLLLVLVPPDAGARQRYGEVRVEKGSMTLLREGAKHRYKEGDPVVIAEYEDLLVVHADSKAILTTDEQAIITIGSNGALQLKPFRQNEDSGLLRVLFGRLRAKLTQLVSGQRFSIKTAQGTIGIKGTEFFTSVTAQGDTLVVVEETEHEVTLSGLAGPPQPLTPNLMAVVVNSKPVSKPAIVTPDIKEELQVEVVDAPVAYTVEAKALPAEEKLIETGIVTRKDLIESKREKVTLQDTIQIDEQAEPLDLNYDLRRESYDPYLRQNLFLRP